MKKILIDKDVITDLLDKVDPGYKPVAKILSDSKKLKLKVFLCDFTLKELYEYVLDKKGAHEAIDTFWFLMQLVRVISPIEKNFRRALASSNPDFTRALAYQVAEDNHLDFIISNDIKAYRSPKLTVISAEQLLSSL